MMQETARREPLTVAIVEDEPLMRDLLRITLSQFEGVHVVGTFDNGDTALQGVPGLQPRVTVLDIDLGRGISGIQLGILLREQLPDLGVVLLSNHWIPRFLAMLPPEVMAGWSYLLKKSVADAATLSRAIEGAAAGLVVLDPAVAAGRQPRAGGVLDRLTVRQREILSLIAQGYTNAVIAEQLALSPSTVENQVNQLYQELGLTQQHATFNPRVRATLLFLTASHSQPGAAGDR